MRNGLFVTLLVVMVVFAGRVEAATITDPTGLDGIVDPAGSESINAEVGNYSSSQFNANVSRRMFQLEVSQGYPGNLEGSFGDIVLTEAVSGIDFSMNLTGVSSWWTRNYNATVGYATSGTNSLVFKPDTVDGAQILTLSPGVYGIGFVLIIQAEHEMTCKFYRDSAGTNLLQQYVAAPTADQSADAGETLRAEMFVGYFNPTTTIERVELHYAYTGSGSASQWNMDDLIVITSVPPRGTTIIIK